MASDTVSLALGVTLGVTSHLGYFIHGEHHTTAWRIFLFVILFPPMALLTLLYGVQLPAQEAIRHITVAVSTYLAGLAASILLYRGVFHRLGCYPGPSLARFSNFYHTFYLARWQNYKLLQKWHDRYGSYVRTGPMELSIIDPDAVAEIYGPRTKCTKGPWYDATLPLTSMHQTRDKSMHSRRRKAWDRGFKAQALRGYEPRVRQYTDALLAQIRNSSGQPLNASRWFNYFSFDVMGDLAYGESFDMLKNGKGHWAISLLNEGQGGLRPFGQLTWLFGILIRIPVLNNGYKKFVKFCEDMIEKRSRMSPTLPDITSWLLNAEPMSADSRLNHMWLVGESRLVIVAGSDTTSATLTYVFYHLAQSPDHVETLRRELQQLPSTPTHADLQDLPHMNGVINEALRLHPPVPSGTQRQTPPDGLQIGKHFVPGNTIVKIPLAVIGRSPECFEYPDKFIPERWYNKPELVKRQDAFFPFSLGPYGCIGKHLALMELRTVIARIIAEFDIELAPGEDGTSLLNDTKDIFTLDLGNLFLRFIPRDVGI